LKRLTLLMAAGSLWLFLAAVPVFADGGPHVSAINNGTGLPGGTTLSADSCAGCHRAHTAQGMYLLKDSAGIATCTSCHGQAGLGATTDVENGIQYVLGTDPTRTGTTLGFLRSGGFVTARIGSGEAVRVAYARTSSTGEVSVSQNAKVPVRTLGSQPVTSAHLPNVGGVIEAADGVAWGNGPNSTTAFAGPAVNVECTTCHNPHGNGAYRILNPIPDPAATGIDVFVPATVAAPVTDAALPAAGDNRNYTIFQTNGGTATLTANQVANFGLTSTAGDYFRKKVPWNGTSGTSNDAPNGISATFVTQMSTWCLTCHTRYLSAGWATKEPDAIYTYRHTSTNTSRNCVTCHVAHGSNAQMTPGSESANMEYPGGAAAPAGDSRLLKVDNRGTCQLCHDPTGTITAGTTVGPMPNPVLP
jgi:predicted CXXCH cytochrome family protein